MDWIGSFEDLSTGWFLRLLTCRMQRKEKGSELVYIRLEHCDRQEKKAYQKKSLYHVRSCSSSSTAMYFRINRIDRKPSTKYCMYCMYLRTFLPFRSHPPAPVPNNDMKS